MAAPMPLPAPVTRAIRSASTAGAVMVGASWSDDAPGSTGTEDGPVRTQHERRVDVAALYRDGTPCQAPVIGTDHRVGHRWGTGPGLLPASPAAGRVRR